MRHLIDESRRDVAGMKICLITPELPPFRFGGIGQYVTDLATEYSQLGHEVVVLGVGIHPDNRIEHPWGTSISLNRPPGRSRQLALALAFRLCRTPGLWRLGVQIMERLQAPRPKSPARRLTDYLADREREFDVIEAPNYPGHAAYLRPRKAKLVLRLSTPAADCLRFGKVATRFEARSCRNADLIIGNSHSVLEKAKSLYGLSHGKFQVIPHGVADVPVPATARRDDGLDLLYVGRCEPRKGTDVLIQSLPEFLSAGRRRGSFSWALRAGRFRRCSPGLARSGARCRPVSASGFTAWAKWRSRKRFATSRKPLGGHSFTV